MKRISIDQLNGGEYLSEAVKLDDNQTLFYEGTCLYMHHIEALVNAGVDSVCIFEPTIVSPKEKRIIRDNIRNDCSKKIKDVLEKYVTYDNGLKVISEAATEIIDEVFSSEEIVDHVYDIKERSMSLYDHSITVASLSVITALKMNLSKWEIHDIGVGSLLHDMGLRYLSVKYQDVDTNDFDANNWFEYKKHSLYGFSSVERESWMSNEAKQIILFHHERLDGSGYPFKKVATSLPVRIVAVADAFDDILCGIGHKKEDVKKALDYIKNGRDVLFDGRIVDSFLEFIAAYPVGTIVITNHGDEALVIEQNEHFIDKPKIKLLRDKFGNTYEEDVVVDLVENDKYVIDYAKRQE